MHYGLKEDLDSESWNPIRDTVFCGNEMAYNTWGSLSMSVAGICVPVGRAINTVAGVATGKEIAKTVMITVAKEKIKDGLAESGTRLIVNKVDERFNLNQTENLLLSGGLNIAFNSGLDKAELRAGLGNNSFATGMSYDEALRNNKRTDACINGTHNNHPGMSDIDLKKWGLADARLNESIAVSKVDVDACSKLKAVEFDRNVKVLDTTIKTDIECGLDSNYKLLNTSSADDVNAIFKETMGYEPPYKPGTTVSEIQLTENSTFVRVYDKTNSRMQGGWVMKVEDIAGLTPQEIQNKFALPNTPNTPKYICDVNLEAGTKLRTGEVNLLFGYEGGGQQYDLIINGKNVGTIKNERIIGQ